MKPTYWGIVQTEFFEWLGEQERGKLRVPFTDNERIVVMIVFSWLAMSGYQVWEGGEGK